MGKNSFRYRHDGFCGKCVKQDVIDVAEQEELDSAVKCRKCSKPKFRSRNALLCSDICQADVELPVNIATNATPIKFQEEESSGDKKEIVKKDTLMKKKEEKQAKKSKKKEAREKRRKEKQERKLAKKNKKFGYPPNSPGWSVTSSQSSKVSSSSEDQPVTLGPLGQLFQAIIVANTW